MESRTASAKEVADLRELLEPASTPGRHPLASDPNLPPPSSYLRSRVVGPIAPSRHSHPEDGPTGADPRREEQTA